MVLSRADFAAVRAALTFSRLALSWLESHELQFQYRRLHLLLLQWSALVWGYRALGEHKPKRRQPTTVNYRRWAF